MIILSFSALFLFSFLALTMRPVGAQAPFDLSWTFDYSPLVSAAPNSVHLSIHNTGFAPIRLTSIGINFPWMDSGAYISAGSPQLPIDLAPDQKGQITISFQIPANVLTGRYAMNTFLSYQVFQTNQYGGPESIVYVLDVIVIGQNSSFSMTFDPYDGRFYSAFAFFTLIGWYLPRKLRPRAKG